MTPKYLCRLNQAATTHTLSHTQNPSLSLSASSSPPLRGLSDLQQHCCRSRVSVPMATPSHLPVTAAQVGTYFVGHYYHVLQTQPDYVHQFYSDRSTLLRVDGHNRETATSMLSVYVKNVPSTATTSDIEEEFKKFGKIRQDGVAIRTRKDLDVCYAFVEFEDITGVHNAIKEEEEEKEGVGIRMKEMEEERVLEVKAITAEETGMVMMAMITRDREAMATIVVKDKRTGHIPTRT
ncbi:hypothetical protein M8C21_016575, partial [Ambrosia artemisiifolia]